ncbi:hypothetical protein [Micromonospora sp. RL09-050-HVF-A]|uniref:hypothetical protein n=1 Tax=Micromonospora sp. RL09-050-HVF-A TaxID=1703433 RepID=UPI001C5F5C2A|nr:hypothetical protein [Micromonospora sp. RL09-050-HVF-A]MBW4704537.1 hypothetical protein [Micromonospora sp. RL09-050-HVF-A]
MRRSLAGGHPDEVRIIAPGLPTTVATIPQLHCIGNKSGTGQARLVDAPLAPIRIGAWARARTTQS